MGLPGDGHLRSYLRPTVRVIYRVHNNTAYGWPNASPTLSTRFTQGAQVMLRIAHFAERRAAV